MSWHLFQVIYGFRFIYNGIKGLIMLLRARPYALPKTVACDGIARVSIETEVTVLKWEVRIRVSQTGLSKATH